MVQKIDVHRLMQGVCMRCQTCKSSCLYSFLLFNLKMDQPLWASADSPCFPSPPTPALSLAPSLAGSIPSLYTGAVQLQAQNPLPLAPFSRLVPTPLLLYMQELKNTPWLKRMPCLIIGRHVQAPREVPVVCKQLTGSLLLGSVREELRIRPNVPGDPSMLSPSEFEAAAGCSKGKNWKV